MPDAAPEGAFKPLRHPIAERMSADEVDRILRAVGHIGGPTVERIDGVRVRGGRHGHGSLTVRPQVGSEPVAAASAAAVLFAVLVGLAECLPKPVCRTACTPCVDVPPGDLVLDIREIDLLTRPHLVAEVYSVDAMQSFGEIEVQFDEGPGATPGPGHGGAAPTTSARTGRDGTPTLLNEFHMAHLSRGDQAVALGPEFGSYTGRRATRLPTGGLLLVDRVIRYSGTRGDFDNVPVEYDTEYDAPADSWYFAETANESMPHFVYMETSLQAALLMGYYTGPTLVDPSATASLRNLGGAATVLRQVELRDKTICQHSRLQSTTIVPGASLQSFDYTLSVDDEPFYTGETLFGYFSDEALANQTGLDGGATLPTWLAGQAEPPASRRIDIAARRSSQDGFPRATGKLALLDWVDVVDGGGHHGLGYLHAVRPIDPDDWFFGRHFHLDPVIPGSLGVETVVQAVQEWMIDSGYGRDLADPGFSIPQGITFGWKYRGQFLPSDGQCEFEVHIKEVRKNDHAVVVVVDGSMWKPGLRIYELTDLAIELHDRGVQG